MWAWLIALVFALLAAGCGGGESATTTASREDDRTAKSEASPDSGERAPSELEVAIGSTITVDLSGGTITDIAFVGHTMWVSAYDPDTDSSAVAELSATGSLLGFAGGGDIPGPASLRSDGSRLLAIGDGDMFIVDAATRTVRPISEFSGDDGDDASSDASVRDAQFVGSDQIVAVGYDRLYVGTVHDDGDNLEYFVDGSLPVVVELGESPEFLWVEDGYAYIKTGPDFYSVVVYDLESGDRVAETALEGRGFVTVAGEVIASSDALGNTIELVDRASYEVLGTVTVADAPGRLLPVDDGLLAVMSEAVGVLMIVDPASAQVLRTVDVPGPGPLALGPDGMLWVGHWDGSTLTSVRLGA